MKYRKFIILLLILIISIVLSNHIVYANEDNLDLESESAILIDNNSGQILYSKNAYDKMYPASTTKILTAIITIEKCNLNDIVTVNKSAISAIPSGYSSAYLSENEKINVKDLLILFLVHSANDAGYVLAEYISGSIENFSILMNNKAKEIGCKNSNFTNPSGIHNENHYSSAYDLSLIAKYCMKNSTFRNIVKMPNCTINATNKSNIRTYTNTNDLINNSSKYYLSDCIGIKTGYTTEAKNCLISCCNKNNIELICVILGSSTTKNGESARYVDSHTLYNYGYSNYSLSKIAKKNELITSTEIINATKETKKLDLILENDITALIKNTEQINEPQININKILSAPISKNSIVGNITYSINGITYTENLIASHDVEVDTSLLTIFRFSLASIILLIIAYILFFKSKKRKKSKYDYDY